MIKTKDNDREDKTKRRNEQDKCIQDRQHSAEWNVDETKKRPPKKRRNRLGGMLRDESSVTRVRVIVTVTVSVSIRVSVRVGVRVGVSVSARVLGLGQGNKNLQRWH
jgi:hypothetical protein